MYKDFVLEYISYQYNHFVVPSWIHVIEIKVNRGELMGWNMA